MIRKTLELTVATLSLGARLAGQVATVSRDVHASVRESVPVAGSARGPADLVYGLVRGSLDLAGTGLGAIARALEDGEIPNDERLLAVIGALNGVFGDALEEQGNPLALRMSLVPATEPPRATRDLVFLHGLCMSDAGWHDGAHDAFHDWAAEALHAAVSHLRYNSGRHISHNGRELAELLERHALAGDRRLILVGHSMGGLVSRSALQFAADNGMRWPERLEALVTLGTPHQGADLERLGNFANTQLRLTRWTAPFTRLGNLRSAGIRDLRFGNLRDADWLQSPHIEHPGDWRLPAETPAHVRHLFVAATRSPALRPGEDEQRLAGDLLVSVESALARRYPGTENVDRLVLPALDHMALMWDARVYETLKDWFRKTVLATSRPAPGHA